MPRAHAPYGLLKAGSSRQQQAACALLSKPPRIYLSHGPLTGEGFKSRLNTLNPRVPDRPKEDPS